MTCTAIGFNARRAADGVGRLGERPCQSARCPSRSSSVELSARVRARLWAGRRRRSRRAGDGAGGVRAKEGGHATMSDKQVQDPKFVQITTSVQGGEILLYALDEAGDVWRFDDKTRQWVRLPRDRR